MERIEGRLSTDGKAYEIVQGDRLIRSIPTDEARADPKLAISIARNRWEAIK